MKLTTKDELLLGYLRDAEVLATTTNVTTDAILRARRHSQLMGPWWCAQDLQLIGLLAGDADRPAVTRVLRRLDARGLALSKLMSGQRFYRISAQGERELEARETA